MLGKDLQKLAEKYPDYEFLFTFTDGYSRFPNVRNFNQLKMEDVGHSDKVVIISGEEEK